MLLLEDRGARLSKRDAGRRELSVTNAGVGEAWLTTPSPSEFVDLRGAGRGSVRKARWGVRQGNGLGWGVACGG